MPAREMVTKALRVGEGRQFRGYEKRVSRINRIEPCEYDHGLSDATLVVPCRSRPLNVHLTVAHGRLVQPSDEALCLT